MIPLFIFILKLNKIYVITGAIIVTVLAFCFSSQPVIPFTTAIVIISIILSLSKNEANEWFGETWGFIKQIMPLLEAGVLVARFLLGSPEGSSKGIIPNEWISNLVGGNSLFSNFFASVTGAFMYFATLTEIPILLGLINSGMSK